MAKFKYIGPNRIRTNSEGKQVELPARCMGGNQLRTGEYVEFDERLSKKAELLPTYEKVNKPGPKPKDDTLNVSVNNIQSSIKD